MHQTPGGPDPATVFHAIASLAIVSLIPSPTVAEPWIVVEAPAAVAVSEPQRHVFRPGIMPALGIYRPISDTVAFGFRARGGVLSDGSGAPGDGIADPDRGGIAAIGLGVRLRIGDAWGEVVGGAGMTGADPVPIGEVGVGWSFAAGSVKVGPSLRYVHLHVGERPMAFGSAGIVLVGVELQTGTPRHRPPTRSNPGDERVAIVDRDPLVDVDLGCATSPDPTCSGPVRDRDGVAATLDHVRDAADAPNGVADAERPDQGDFVVEDDRIVLDDRVLFDVDRAHIHRAGRRVIAAIAAAITSHAEWRHVAIEGHADVRGSDELNAWLSATRAERVRAGLVAAGVAADRVSAVGLGASQPRDAGRSDAAHHRNRRVEFVIARHPIAGSTP